VLDHAELRALASKLAEYLAVTARMVGGSQATGEELAERFALHLRDMPPG